MSEEFDAIKKQIQNMNEQTDYIIKTKDEVIAQLNSMYSVLLNNRDAEIEKLKAELERIKGIARKVCGYYGGVRKLSGYEVALAPARCIREDLEEIFINEIAAKKTVSGKLARECAKELDNE